jgi:hypothetical protein
VRPAREVRVLLEERRRLINGPDIRVQLDSRDQPADARQRFA